MTDQQPPSYPYVGVGEGVPPDYDRVVRRLSVEELHAELDGEKGEAAYRHAVRAELDRRAAEESDA